MNTTIDNSKRYVLVVEDNAMISMILVDLLKSMNIVAIVADNGRIAVEKFTSFMKEG
jgi:CheY-like chemotaxis protein